MQCLKLTLTWRCQGNWNVRHDCLSFVWFYCRLAPFHMSPWWWTSKATWCVPLHGTIEHPALTTLRNRCKCGWNDKKTLIGQVPTMFTTGNIINSNIQKENAEIRGDCNSTCVITSSTTCFSQTRNRILELSSSPGTVLCARTVRLRNRLQALPRWATSQGACFLSQCDKCVALSLNPWDAYLPQIYPNAVDANFMGQCIGSISL